MASPFVRRTPPSRLTLAGALGVLLLCGGLFVYGSGRGFDLTDEAFYLIWTRDPNAYALTYQPFGRLLHPLYELVREDLQTYRLAGILLVGLAGGALGLALGRLRAQSSAFGLYGAAAALTVFFPWILTPSYNSAANLAALLLLAGALDAAAPERRWRVLGALLAAAGLCVAAFAKPPLFALSVLTLGLTAVGVGRTRAPIAVAAAVAAALIFLVVPPPDLLALVWRILASQQALGLPNTVSGLPLKVVRDAAAIPPPLAAAAVAALASLAAPPRASSWLGYAAAALTIAYAPRAIIDLIDGDLPDFLGLALCILATAYAGLVRPAGRAPRIALAGLILAPSAVALGTFNNQWGQLNFSMAFPLLALFTLAATDDRRWRRATAASLALAAPLALLTLAALRPYSLPTSIFEQQVPVAAPIGRGLIRVDTETADFLQGAKGKARGQVVMDLSGTGPGVTIVLGGHAPVLAWLNPATPHWPDLVWAALTPDQRRGASFVTPVWPAFAASEPARWFGSHRSDYCRTALPAMWFWGDDRPLELWRPCAAAGGAHRPQATSAAS